jgi:hypothetical protein
VLLVAAAREELERSGESVEAMAQTYDEYIDRITRDAARQPQNSAPALMLQLLPQG